MCKARPTNQDTPITNQGQTADQPPKKCATRHHISVLHVLGHLG